MENQTWKPGGTFFKPAPQGLSLEELAKRAERESIANHGFALVMSNGPMPDGEALLFMQKYVDGEWTLQQALEELKKFHGLGTPSPEQNTAIELTSISDEAMDADEQYWSKRMQEGQTKNNIQNPGVKSNISLPDLFSAKQTSNE